MREELCKDTKNVQKYRHTFKKDIETIGCADQSNFTS